MGTKFKKPIDPEKEERKRERKEWNRTVKDSSLYRNQVNANCELRRQNQILKSENNKMKKMIKMLKEELEDNSIVNLTESIKELTKRDKSMSNELNSLRYENDLFKRELEEYRNGKQ